MKRDAGHIFLFILLLLFSNYSYALQKETIAIIGTNDIHGAVLPFETELTNPSGITHYHTAGVATLAALIRHLAAEYPGRWLWLDAGDEFQGSIESNSFGGAPMVTFFNYAGLTAAAIGNHEFDFGLKNLKERMHQAHYPYLAANIFTKKTGQRALFPNTYSSKLFTLGEIKVGVIGLSTLETPYTTKAENVKTLLFANLKKTTENEVAKLRKKGATIILLTAHVGLHCDNEKNLVSSIHTKDEVQPPCHETPSDEMVLLLKNLKPGTIDAVVAGHSHTIVHNWIAGVPVVQSGVYGKYIHVIYLTYDKDTKKILPEETRIEGPIPVCTHIFANQQNCDNLQETGKSLGELIPFTMHGRVMQEDLAVKNLLHPYVQQVAGLKHKRVGFAMEAVPHFKNQESPLANFATDTLRELTHADVAILGSGNIRAGWNKGPITYGDVYRSFPFDNFVMSFMISGADLKKVLSIISAGEKSPYHTSGLQLTLCESPKKLIKATMANGDPILDQKKYRFSTIDFLIQGGDDFKDTVTITKSIPKITHELMRDAMIARLATFKQVNTPEDPLIDPHHARLLFIKCDAQGKPL